MISGHSLYANFEKRYKPRFVIIVLKLSSLKLADFDAIDFNSGKA